MVLPVAGRGKRLMPLTKKTPKNLIEVHGKPLVEYALDEAAQSGIKDAVLIVNPDHKPQFERYVASRGRRYPFRFHIREQKTPGGNGHAIAQAADMLRGKPCVVRFCDDIVVAKPPVISSLVDLFGAVRGSVVLLERVPKPLVSRFGVVGVSPVPMPENGPGGSLYRINEIVEKPPEEKAPSNLSIVGGYALTPRILEILEKVAATLPVIADDALPLAVAFQVELLVKGRVFGWEFKGKRLDCGTLEKLQKTEEYLDRRPLS